MRIAFGVLGGSLAIEDDHRDGGPSVYRGYSLLGSNLKVSSDRLSRDRVVHVAVWFCLIRQKHSFDASVAFN